MARLYEEVVTRLEEMALITARTLKMNTRNEFVVTFKPVAEESRVELSAVEILRTPQGKGCYNYREGTCFKTAASQTDLEPNK